MTTAEWVVPGAGVAVIGARVQRVRTVGEGVVCYVHLGDSRRVDVDWVSPSGILTSEESEGPARVRRHETNIYATELVRVDAQLWPLTNLPEHLTRTQTEIPTTRIENRLVEITAKDTTNDQRRPKEDVEELAARKRFPMSPSGAGSFGEGPHWALREWWMHRAASEIDPMLDKMDEYGGNHRAIDLEEIGRGLVQSGVAGPPPGVEEGAWYSELGVYFYLLGKFARWTAAVSEGRLVSDDTLLDIGVYIRMAQRIRTTGGWPE